MDREALKAGAPLAAQQLRQMMGWLESALTGRDFINGERPSGGDFTLYSTLWFAGNAGFDFRPFPQLNAWRKRMKAFGRGQALPMTALEALDLANRHTPRTLPEGAVHTDPTGLTAGQAVVIQPESLGHGTSVRGTLVALSERRMTVSHSSPRCGTVHVHFPRLGYRVRAE
jgi:hypothetical protein